MKHYKTLVLNAGYQPISLFPEIHAIPAEDAVTRVYNLQLPTCRVVAEYDEYIKTPTYKIKWPAVIARIRHEQGDLRTALKAETLYYRDHGICAYCGKNLTLQSNQHNSITMDHVHPKSKGGLANWDNTVASCPNCNHTKSNALPVGKWRPSHKSYTPSYWDLLKARRKFPITIYHESWMDFIGEWEAEVKLRG